MKRILCILSILIAFAIFTPANAIIGIIKTHISGNNGLYTLQGKKMFTAEYGLIKQLPNGLFLLKNGYRVGIADAKGRFLIPPLYYEISYEAPYYIVKSDEFGVRILNSFGRDILPANTYWSDIHISDDSLLAFSAPYTTASLLTLSGEVKRTSSFTFVSSFCDNRMIVNNGSATALLNHSLDTILPFRRDIQLMEFVNDTTLLAYNPTNDKYGYINVKDSIVAPFVYSRANRLYSSLPRLQNYYEVRKGDSIGVLNAQGREVVPCQYKRLERRTLNYTTDCWLVSKGNGSTGWGVIKDSDAGAQLIVPMEYELEYGKLHSNFVFDGNTIDIQRRGNDGAVYDMNGRSIIPKGKWKRNIQRRLWAVADSGSSGKYDLVNNKGDYLTNAKYNLIDSIAPNMIRVEKNHVFGIIDTLGNYIVPLEYDKINAREYNTTKAIKLLKDTAVHLFTDKRHLIILDSIRAKVASSEVKLVGKPLQLTFVNGCAIATSGYRYGMIDEWGVTILPFEYRMIRKSRNANEYEVCDTKNEWYLYRWEAEKLHLLEKMDATQTGLRNRISVKAITDDLAIYLYLYDEKYYKYDLAKKSGKKITTKKYDNIDFLETVGNSHLFTVENSDGKKGVINEKGKIIVPIQFSEIKIVEYKDGKYIKTML